jgi:hypothetical protein
MNTFFNRFVQALCLLGALGLAACSQQTSTEHTISGRVLFKDDLSPMKQVVLSLLQENGKEGLSKQIVGQSQISAVDGSYTFTFRPFKNDDATNVLISSSAGTRNDLNFEQQNLNLPVIFEQIEASLVLEDEDLMVDILGDPFGFLEVRINRDDPLFFGESIQVKVSGDGFSFATSLGAGDAVNRNLSYPVYTDKKVFLEWESDFNGVVEAGSDSVTCATAQSTTYVLYF